MRHILALVMSLLAMVSLSAQTGHVRFLGVPLDGTIQQFQEQLTSKGCTLDQQTSAVLPKGTSAFKGAYFGHDAMLIVFYDETTNVVYQAKAVVTCQDGQSCETVFNDINSQLQSEYGILLSTKSIQFGHESYGYTILSDQRVVMGDVGIFVTGDENHPGGFLVQVQYIDTANLRMHERQDSDDN